PNLKKCCHRQSSRVVSYFAPHVHGLAGLGELTTDPLEGAIHSQRSLRSCELPGLAGPDYLSDVRPRTGPHRAVEARAGPFCCSLYRPIAGDHPQHAGRSPAPEPGLAPVGPGKGAPGLRFLPIGLFVGLEAAMVNRIRRSTALRLSA